MTPQTPDVALLSTVRRFVLTIACVLAIFLTAYFYLSIPRTSEDLLPLWLAGQAFGEGAQFYADVDPIYMMAPPENWAATAREIGFDGALYPFVYPPLWAWLLSFVEAMTSFEVFEWSMTILNPIMLVATCVCAWQLTERPLPLTYYLLITNVVLLATVVGYDPIKQNQAHILVCFLIVCALERSKAKHPKTAGAVLALAASIKLFPAIFAIFWFFSGERRAFASFLVAGAALGLLSIGVAGWPLHQVFLAHVAAINDTAFASPFSFSLGNVWTRFFPVEVMTANIAHTSQDFGAPWGVSVAEKPVVVKAVGTGISVLVIALFAIGMARFSATQRYQTLWPAFFAIFPVLGSLAWAYYFIPATVFVPILIKKLGALAGFACLAILYAPLTIWAFVLLRVSGFDTQTLGAAIFVALGTLFLISGFYRRR